MLPNAASEKLKTLPQQPGVYVFRAAAGECLYVGKASNLRSRVRSYFRTGTSDSRYFIPLLADVLADIETIVTASEKEATILEAAVIKTERPRYNVRLRDDKDYLSLRLDVTHPYPRLEVVRRPKPDGARYFGPYPSATAARSTLKLANRHFQLRTCTDREMRARTRPCLQYQIHRCSAPCVLPVDPAEYAKQIAEVALFLDGRHHELAEDLTQQMRAASETTQYERAAVLRNRLHAIEDVQEGQRVARVSRIDQDVIGLHREGEDVEVALLMLRAGRVTGVRTFSIGSARIPDPEVLAAFVTDYYARTSFVPGEVLLPAPVEAMSGLAALLGESRGTRVRVRVPRRGAAARILEMARENAEHAFAEKARARKAIERRLVELRETLRLPRLPRYIECIDVSHMAGTDTVAAIVALRDGVPDRRQYRTFHVRGAAASDDYGAMREVLIRRLRRSRGRSAAWAVPDLLVVDGGKGQLNIAAAVLRDLGVTNVPVVALAKEKELEDDKRVIDRIFLEGQKNAIPLRESADALRLLAIARDEAHRFSNAFRTQTHRRRNLRSSLDDIAGLGPKTRNRLLRAFGSLAAVREATPEALIAAGATRAQAASIARMASPDSSATLPTDLAETDAVDHAFSD